MDFLIVGAGLTGATIARTLHDAGYSVQVIDQRPHIAGNVHDQTHESGIRWHTYGPHYFRTNNERLWGWVNRFADWYRYEPCLQALTPTGLEPWPVTRDYLERTVGAWHPEFTGTPENFEQASLAKMPRQVYDTFVKGYTEKQWGQPAHTLCPELAGRFDIHDTDLRLKQHRHQGIPVGGYTAWVEAILDGIPVQLDTAWEHQPARHTVYTGPIDALFDHDLGHLAYRSQHREHTHHDQDWWQPCGQVNTPSPDVPTIRVLEWKHMLHPDEQEAAKGTLVTTETPIDGGHEYPVPDMHQQALYQMYRARIPADITACGRLGEYRYYDMDQAIGRALTIARRWT